jgi:hypothetical protein
MELRSSFRLQDPNIQQNQPRSPVRLCSVCKSIDFVAAASQDDWKTHHKHHSSLETLRNAARKGCQLCQVIIRYGKKASHRRYDLSTRDEEWQHIFYHTSDGFIAGGDTYLGATRIDFYQKGDGFFFRGDLLAKAGKLSYPSFS